MLNRRNCSKRYRASISSYDIHITTKSYNVDELISLGARRVRFIQNGYDPATHRPVVLTPNDRSLFETDVVFIGQWERARQLSLETLIRTIPDIKLRVWGPGWKHVPKGSNLWPCLMMRSVYGSEYAKAICASKICLGFLSKANRDLQTTRSIEIPACEGFLLAERTDEHLNLFQENTEVEFFDCDEELCFKVQYYLAHENQRRQIALNGRIRCLRSGYSNQALLASVLREITSV
jgi:spore maturation protein CgeB